MNLIDQAGAIGIDRNFGFAEGIGRLSPFAHADNRSSAGPEFIEHDQFLPSLRRTLGDCLERHRHDDEESRGPHTRVQP